MVTQSKNNTHSRPVQRPADRDATVPDGAEPRVVECLTSKPTVFLLDDHEIMRGGVRHLLSRAGIHVVGDSGSVADALRRIPVLGPDVVLMESHYTDSSGGNACRRIRSACPGIYCVIFAHDFDEGAQFDAIQSGAAGYLSKHIRGEDLVDTVRRVAAGEVFFDEAPRMRDSRRMQDEARSNLKLALLSAQERRIVTGMAQGMSNRQIAEELFLAEKTVRNYVSIALAKLGFERRGQTAVLLGREWNGA